MRETPFSIRAHGRCNIVHRVGCGIAFRTVADLQNDAVSICAVLQMMCCSVRGKARNHAWLKLGFHPVGKKRGFAFKNLDKLVLL
jgi:hypothetical protein